MSSSVNFWNRSAARYARRPIADQNAYLKKIDLTQNYFHSEMDVLEFGCGTGSTALIHAPKVRSYLATDASARMIEIARERLAKKHADNLTFQVASIDDLQQRQQTFDAVLGLNILHLLRDPKFCHREGLRHAKTRRCVYQQHRLPAGYPGTLETRRSGRETATGRALREVSIPKGTGDQS